MKNDIRTNTTSEPRLHLRIYCFISKTKIKNSIVFRLLKQPPPLHTLRALHMPAASTYPVGYVTQRHGECTLNTQNLKCICGIAINNVPHAVLNMYRKIYRRQLEDKQQTSAQRKARVVPTLLKWCRESNKIY